MYHIEVHDSFHAGHAVKLSSGAWEKSHVHDWQIRIFLSREQLDASGMVVDFNIVKKALRQILEVFEGKNLNEIETFQKNPTTEKIAWTIFDEMQKRFGSTDVSVTSVGVCEAENCWAWYEQSGND
jgi:6-pyruvoyltetrahydropterin/6-carboxytetrahydropterin synthase